MTQVNEKQWLEDCVIREVDVWDHQNSMDVFLSTGYGPPLQWKLYEFRPKTAELLEQLQYFQDVSTGRTMSRLKYSLPLGLLKVDPGDEAQFDAYVQELLHPEHLSGLGKAFYYEESLVDKHGFQEKLLQCMCKLYLESHDEQLREQLRDILRMIIISYIMGHTIYLVEDTLPTVFGRIRHTVPPAQDDLVRYISPRLANRQFKFFFLHRNIYTTVLKRQQATLHAGNKKEATWLQAFCVVVAWRWSLKRHSAHCRYKPTQKSIYGKCRAIMHGLKHLMLAGELMKTSACWSTCLCVNIEFGIGRKRKLWPSGQKTSFIESASDFYFGIHLFVILLTVVVLITYKLSFEKHYYDVTLPWRDQATSDACSLTAALRTGHVFSPLKFSSLERRAAEPDARSHFRPLEARATAQGRDASPSVSNLPVSLNPFIAIFYYNSADDNRSRAPCVGLFIEMAVSRRLMTGKAYRPDAVRPATFNDSPSNL
ncbi:hypothetical protein MRB53_039702 [Persea americana]|nr:hypothetical protein MRB53_039702 [Persea americana]